MPEVKYGAFPELLKNTKQETIAPVYLLHGDEFLYKSVFRALLDALVPPNQQSLNYEALDGATVNVHETIERMNTFALFPGAKVVAVHDTDVFSSKVNVGNLLLKSKEASDKQDLKESARYFVRALGAARLSLDDICQQDHKEILSRALRDDSHSTKIEFGPWLDQVVDYCVREQLSVPTHEDDAEVLKEAIIFGFPETNHLVLTTEFIDKRRKLFKTIKTKGMVIDCSVPKGDRMAEKRQQREMLRIHVKQTLAGAGKSMGPSAFEALCERTGGGLRNYNNELEKLISFIGDRKEILVDDVEAVSKRTRQDPIYELSNAIGERNTTKALFFVESLLKANLFPLQVLAAAINQVRKLVLARDFIRTVERNGWNAHMTFQSFKKNVLPRLDKHGSDVLTSKTHPYVLYKTLGHCDNYTFEELVGALGLLLDADIRLKTSGQNPKVILENAIMGICGV